ncbi:rop guanine nucleotide exchange factor 1-like [Euphorbia lathyris]|uniref:rop guanine nucleotide exchange factor 1-like n=1 Tax=Euphorbia lathyris TaxID=212925 RepID=UPI0033139243
MMKEQFAKLLLGEDMSGGRKGISPSLAISNAITDLSASVFGDLRKLEPLSPEMKSMWHKEMELLLCVSDSIVEFVPSMQDVPGGGGGAFEVMITRPRSDLFVKLPSLKNFDAMLLSILDEFSESEFYYIDDVVTDSHQEKWWLPFPRVPRNGLSEDTRKSLYDFKESTNHVLKAAMTINCRVMAQMEIPNDYFESIPKSGKACLGEDIYRQITSQQFCPESLLDYLDLSSEYTTLEIANRIEAASHIWMKKHQKVLKVQEKSSRNKVKVYDNEVEKGKVLAKRADIMLHKLRLRFPAVLLTNLDMKKIQHNKDIGHAIIESYSRVIESLAFNMLARIDDILCADDAAKQPAAAAELASLYYHGRLADAAVIKQKPMSCSSSFPSRPSISGDPSDGKIKILNGKMHNVGKKNKLKHLLANTI